MSVQESDNEWDEVTEIPHTEPSPETTEGPGGDDLSAWDLERAEKLRTLCTTTTFNESSYTLPTGVVDTQWDVGFEDAEYTHESPDNQSIEGAGGDPMEIWLEDRHTKLRELGGATFTNNSGFGVPTGVVDTSPNFDVGLEAGEQLHGSSATFQILRSDGTPLPGDAYLEIEGMVAAAEAGSSGEGVLNAPPPAYALLGESGERPAYSFIYSAAIDGANVLETLDAQHDTFAVIYGSIEGTITDYAGNTMSDVAVLAAGAGTTTDESGYYELEAPGGSTVTLQAIGETEQLTPPPGGTLTRDWRYSRITIEVVNPDFDPVEGMPVQVGPENYVTDENGRIEIDPAEIGVYGIEVSNQIEDSVTVGEQGTSYELRYGDDSDQMAGIRVYLVDTETGDPITNLPAQFADGLRAHSDDDGVLALFTEESGTVPLDIGIEDRRYKAQGFELDLTTGETLETRLELKRAPGVTNR